MAQTTQTAGCPFTAHCTYPYGPQCADCARLWAATDCAACGQPSATIAVSRVRQTMQGPQTIGTDHLCGPCFDAYMVDGLTPWADDASPWADR